MSPALASVLSLSASQEHTSVSGLLPLLPSLRRCRIWLRWWLVPSAAFAGAPRVGPRLVLPSLDTPCSGASSPRVGDQALIGGDRQLDLGASVEAAHSRDAPARVLSFKIKFSGDVTTLTRWQQWGCLVAVRVAGPSVHADRCSVDR